LPVKKPVRLQNHSSETLAFNSFRLNDSLVDPGGEEEVLATAASDNVLETRFIRWEPRVGRVPSVDTSLVEVDDGDLDVGTVARG
jgi:hypothetical protein